MLRLEANGQNRLLFSKNEQPASRLRALRQRLLSLPDPVLHGVGIPRPPLDIPTNILVFARHARCGVLSAVPHANLDQTVLIMNLEGTGTVLLDQKPISLAPGQALFVFPHQIHAYADVDPARHAWLFISFQIERDFQLSPLRNAPVPISRQAWDYADSLLELYPAHAPAPAATAARIAVLLWSLILELSAGADPARLDDLSPAGEALVARVQQFMVDHMRGPIRIRDLARALSISESKLCRDFQDFMHVGLGAYLRRWRVLYACRLMESTDATLSSIAAECGFTSIYAFSRTFSRIMGLSPREWRARNEMDRRGSRRRVMDPVCLNDCR